MSMGRQRAALFAATVNIVLFFGKLSGGLLGRSAALLADALDSLTDLLGDVAVLGGVWVAQKPPDDAHQYGHFKAESIATALVGLLIVAGAVAMLARNILTFRKPTPQPEIWTVFIAAASIIICTISYLYLRSRAKKYSSPALGAGAAHKLADAFTSVAALIGIVLSVAFHLPWGDRAASAVVAIWVIRTGVKIIFHGGHELLDGAPEPDIEKLAIKIIRETPGVSMVRNLRMRSAGGKIFAELDITIAPNLSITDAHIIAHRVKNRLAEKIENLADAIVHTEPCRKNTIAQSEISHKGMEILSSCKKLRGFHGIAVLPSNNGFILVADIVVSPNITVREAHNIADELRNRMLKIPNLADAILHIDYQRD